MTLWLILTILTAGAAIIVATPFLLRNVNAGEAASSLAVYKDQLAEVERDQAQGLIEEAEAASGRLEIERRILSAGKEENAPAERIAPNWQYRMVTGVAAIVVLGSVGLYASLGRPELSSVSPQAQDAWAQRAAVAANAGAQGQITQPADGQQGGDVEAMVKRLEQRLEANSKDPDGWRVLGWSYDSTGRYQDAATAYGRAVELQKDNAMLRALYGEAQVKAANGVVTPAALATFEDVLAINPGDERARFFKGVAKEQKGDNQGAIDEWLALYKIAPADAEWTGDLRSRIEETAQKAGIDVRTKLAEARPAAAATAVAQAPAAPAHPGAVGPSAADVENAKQLSEQDRQSMVSGMVDRLAGRLETSPKDPDGWIMLIRSRVAMKDAEKARAALEKAKTVFADEPETQQRIVQAAQAMGIAAN